MSLANDEHQIHQPKLVHSLSLGDHLQDSPIFHGKTHGFHHGFPVDLPPSTAHLGSQVSPSHFVSVDPPPRGILGSFWLGFRILYDWGGNHSDAKKKAIGESPIHHPHFSIFMAGNHQFTRLAHCYIPKDGLWQLWEGHGWHTLPKPRVQLKDDSTNPESRARRTPAPCPKNQIFHKISWSIMIFPLRLLLCFLVGGGRGQKIFPSLETLEIQNMSMSFPISWENVQIISIIDQWSYLLIPIMIDQKKIAHKKSQIWPRSRFQTWLDINYIEI